LNNIIDTYEAQFEKDKDAHVAAIDALIQILEDHKQKVLQRKADEKP
jgi:hypothetical protein